MSRPTAAAVAALAADDDLMFRMACETHKIDNADQLSQSLRSTIIAIAAEETEALAAALRAEEEESRG